MSKLVSDKPFGETLSSDMNIGDLVSWTEWKIEDQAVIVAVFYGTIVEKTTATSGNRLISIIKVACSDTGSILQLNPFQLRIEKTI
tara:strand:+ start:586 stop:843 length:258 start_codon:yes stop_codon:yes gene_type:complete